MPTVLSAYIPRSERGRRVARVLREAGYAVHDSDVQGRYLCNVDAVRNKNLDYGVRREIAYALNPEAAATAESDAYATAESIRSDPRAWGIPPAHAELEAQRAEEGWC